MIIKLEALTSAGSHVELVPTSLHSASPSSLSSRAWTARLNTTVNQTGTNMTAHIHLKKTTYWLIESLKANITITIVMLSLKLKWKRSRTNLFILLISKTIFKMNSMTTREKIRRTQQIIRIKTRWQAPTWSGSRSNPKTQPIWLTTRADSNLQP